MFGSLGVPELIFIFALALLIFGPRKLPEIGRTIGRGLSEFRKASTDLKRSINAEMIEEEIRQSDPRKIMDEDPIDSPTDAEEDDATGKSEPPDVAGESSGSAPPEGSVPRSGPGASNAGTSSGSSSSGEESGSSSSGDELGSPASGGETKDSETP